MVNAIGRRRMMQATATVDSLRARSTRRVFRCEKRSMHDIDRRRETKGDRAMLIVTAHSIKVKFGHTDDTVE